MAKYVLLIAILIVHVAFALTLNTGDDGKHYKSVKIGSQVWMAENLNIDVPGSKCYDNKPENCDKYGRMYDWKTAKTACPKGWHLPTNAEWDKLYRYIDGSSGTENPYKSEVAGKYLKAKSGWNYGGNGTDSYGFAALPGGRGDSDGGFSNVGGYGDWWSATELSANGAYVRRMNYDGEDAYWYYDYKTLLFSVRCVKD